MTEIAVRPEVRPSILRPLVQPGELIAAQNEIGELIVKALKKGVDYGLVPGTKGKETLFKAGSERLQKAFGCHTVFEVMTQEIDHDRVVKWSKQQWNSNTKRREEVTGESLGLYRYVVRATVVGPNGTVVGSGLGTCSSLENKYVDRPRDLENTIAKMAMKRAKVAATLDAFGLSDRFTQDMEDAPRDDHDGDDSDDKFDYENPTHRGWLEKQLVDKKIPKERFNDIAIALRGKPSTYFEKALAQVGLS